MQDLFTRGLDANGKLRPIYEQSPDLYKYAEELDRYTNLFNVITFGTEARFGSISAEYDYFYNWADIFPEIYKTPELREIIETKEDVANNIKPGAVRQEVIIGGMFNHEILIDVLRNFTIYMNAGSKEIKVICRYQQYRAVGKMIDRLRQGSDWKERSGVIWHTQGSGKSLTMVFLVKKMRSEFDLKDFKILMVVDRLDLENQLSETADLTDEKVNQVSDKQYLVTLKTDTPNLNLVMIHKFADNYDESQDILYRKGIVPKFEPLGELNPSEKILILIDEAHRSQNGDMNNNLFMAFPNATRFGFTGTPLLTPRHKITTAERFCDVPGKFIDTYKMNDAVRDRATVDVKYIGMSRAKRLGYLLTRIRIHYKDETLDLKWASPKVRKLIDKYVRNLNIEERVSEISILSEDFPKEISKYTKSKSQASAMEHAIRHHIKVNLENKDPALYSRFKDRLESIIQRYQGNWDQMLVELKELQKLIAEGRKGDARFKSIQMPFYESLKMTLSNELSEDVDTLCVFFKHNFITNKCCRFPIQKSDKSCSCGFACKRINHLKRKFMPVCDKNISDFKQA